MEFQKVMRQWKRMCKSMQEKNMSCKEDCPLGHNLTCGQLEDASLEEINNAETVIMKWAAEHPEPVYPTWGEWFAERGDLIKLWRNIRVCSAHGAGVIGFLYDHIPADIAQKLGIEQKEE